MNRLAYSCREVAELLGLSLRTVERRITDGTLASFHVGAAVRIPASAVHALLGAVQEPRESDRDAERWAREAIGRAR